MAERLDGKIVAILATDGFEEVELTEPRSALEKAGAKVEIIAPHDGRIQANRHREMGSETNVDRTLEHADPTAYDGLMIPGGLFSPDALRTNDEALAFVQTFFTAGKPVAAICHGPQILISAGLCEGRVMTGVKAIQIDLANAGARVVDEAVCTDRGLVTSRNPDDLPDFCAKLIEEVAEGHHRRQAAAE